MKAGSALDGRAFGAGAQRECAAPHGDQPVGSALELGECGRHLIPIRLQHVDAQIERRACGKRCAFLRPVLAENGGEVRIEPFRIIARDYGGAPATSALSQRDGALVRSSMAAGAKRDPSNSLTIASVRSPRSSRQHAEHDGARAHIAHDIGARSSAAQRVIDQAGNRSTVARTCEAVRQTPVLQRVGRRTPPRIDIGKTSMAAEIRAAGVMAGRA